MKSIVVHSLKYSSRLFLVHKDGSGTELLSSYSVDELLHQAYSDPTIALLTEPLPDKQGAHIETLYIHKVSHFQK